jgi:hypothetical protein
VITGEGDVLIPARNSEIITERIPGARYHVVAQEPQRLCAMRAGGSYRQIWGSND